MFEELLRLLTFLQVHNGPWRVSSESYNERLSIEQQQQQQPELINEARFLCSSDSVEEKNEVDEQSGRTIQRQIPQ